MGQEEDFLLAGSNLAADQAPILKSHYPIVRMMLPGWNAGAEYSASSGSRMIWTWYFFHQQIGDFHVTKLR